MKTENKIVIILFIMAFSTVFLLYSMTGNSDSGFSPAGETPVVPTKADIGKTVYVQGTVLNKRMTYTGDNLILNIECGDGEIRMIFVPKSAGAGEVNRRIEPGDYIGVKGTVEEYNETLEVIPKNESYVIKLKT
ncbi:MAG: OB-fold nucleic acid binding domain-containing protein [Methanimicrococcus sp.]|nr:OB-fold nucleic acid binding domain-containing protein [Methanimicrococcus sp.]